jgi:hypothetical protein
VRARLLHEWYGKSRGIVQFGRAATADRDAPLALLAAKSGFAFLAEGRDALAEII